MKIQISSPRFIARDTGSAEPFLYPEENNPLAGDWRPGSTRRQEGRPLNKFLRTQQEKLLELRAALVSSLNGGARDALLEKPESSAFATHSADAGSDACDRELVLSLLSQGANALWEVDQALQRIEAGCYGICEMSGLPIPASRLRAVPFARFTVECQAKIEEIRLSKPRLFPSPFSMAGEEERADFDRPPALGAQDACELVELP